ncbi:sensor histidine kinase [Sutcliffiella halmapala]|uniref:sensor histidine kinase n=1 Tax=Sutcliffiella halmapala TaxID=79882 RepID=UPI000994DD72|nr:HAMP domain-containing sensor histidine kinase [Sutcliffiella halmapala]
MNSRRLFFLPQKKPISIKKQFFVNYTLLFIILLLLGIVTLIANTIYVESVYEDLDQEYLKELYEDVQVLGMKKAFQKNALPERSYLEYVSNDYTVLDQYNSPHEVGYHYGLHEFLRETNHYDADLYIPEGDPNYLLLYFPVESYFKLDDIFLFTVLFFMICLLFILRWYVKRTSTQIIQPIDRLLTGVHHISQGNYATKIQFQANKEFNQLKNDINSMASKIGEEIALKERSESLRKQLILDISHDLKTPLTNIQGYAETLCKFPALIQEERQKYSSIIMENSTRANRLIQDLFELSQLEMQPNKVFLVDCNLTEVIRTIFSTYVDELEAKGICYDVDIPDNMITVKLNAHLFERVITNMLQNCITYGDKHVTLSLRGEKNKAILTIEDNGKGIPIDYHRKVFEPFIRVDESRNMQTGGTGLGLAIVQKIIAQHNGTISIDSSYTEGCRFVIVLPLSGDGGKLVESVL